MRTNLLWLGLVGQAAASAAGVQFEGRYWITDTNAQVRVERGSIGTDLDLKKDLGVEDQNLPDLRFTISQGRSRIRFGFSRTSYSGDREVARTFAFAGRTYTFGTRVVSDVDVTHVRVGWAFQFIEAGEGRVRFGTLVQGHGFVVNTLLDAPNLRPPVREEERLGAGVPTAGLILDINPHDVVNVFGEFSGISVGRYGYFVESEFGARVLPVGNLSLTAGYRIFNLHAKYEPDFARLRIRGPFVGAAIRF